MVREAHLLLEGHCKRKAARRKGRQQLGWTTSAQPRPWNATRASSHCETGLVSRRILGLLASCQSLPSRSRAGGPAAASACSYLGLVLADSPARHGFCSFSLAEAEKPRQDALCCGRGEATGAFLLREGCAGHTTPSHNLRHHRGLVPLAVGEGIPPLEHKGAQVEAPRRVRPIHPGPVAVGRGRSG